MSEAPRWPPSPAWPWLRVVVAGVFFLVWLGACLADWFGHPEASILPGWFVALGVLVLGYLLGLDLINLATRRRRSGD
jgi:protein-S-isoprenylcysteine O-methyltransferase Ste14